MLRNRLSRVLVVLLTLAVAVALYVGPNVLASDGTPITILHVNDVHARLEPFKVKDATVGGMAQMATLVGRIRAEQRNQVLLLAAGDMIHGTNIANLFMGVPVVKSMNYMYFDAMTIGNHEFNYGQEALENLAKQASFPFLGANILRESGATFTVPYSVKTINGLRVAIIGLTAPETPIVTHPKNVVGLTFADPIATAKKMVAEVADADLIIALTHLGADLDARLAQEVPEINVIVGGHSHTRIDQPKVVGNTLIVQTGEYGQSLGRLDIKVAGKKVVSYNGQLLPVDASLAPAGSIENIINTYKTNLEARMSTVIGETKVALDGERANVRTRETNLGNYVADVMRKAAGADVAITNGGGIRASIAQGSIKVNDVYTVLPFDNTLVIMEVTGAQILKVLETSLAKFPEQNGGFLQVSGLSVVFDPAKPAGSRVVEVKVGGVALDPAKSYKLATNDFTAAGGDGYDALKEAKLLVNTGEMLRDVMVKAIQAEGAIEPKVEGRIVAK